MPSIEEMSTWSSQEILDQTESLLPEGWDLSMEPHADGYWDVQVRRQDDTPEGAVEFFDSHVDLKIALLNVYGALLARNRRPGATSTWETKQELTKRPVGIKSSGIPDPEDLDPNEVESVYQTLRGKRTT